MLPLGGTNANLKVVEELRVAVAGAVEQKQRAVMVKVDMKAEELRSERTVPETASLSEDFAAVAESLSDAVPCMVLIRLKGDGEEASVPGAAEAEWAMLCWTPESSPVKLKMGCASSRKTLRDAFPSLLFKEYQVTERSEVTLAQFLESTKAMTKEDRRSAMTQQEIDQDKVREAQAEEKRNAPKKLAGLVALQIKVNESFTAAIDQLSGEAGKAVLGRLIGPKSEELGGEAMEIAASSSPTALRGCLPAEESCYVILLPKQDQLLLISWLPDRVPVKLKMKCSTFKASIKDVLTTKFPDHSISSVELSEEDELVDDLVVQESNASAANEAETVAAAPKPVGFKPPVGGFALPGMGKGKGRGAGYDP